jgi:hypothetical protein
MYALRLKRMLGGLASRAKIRNQKTVTTMINFELDRSKIFQEYNNGDYIKALKLVEDAEIKYIEEESLILYWKACFNSLLGNIETALISLQLASDRGFWLSPKEIESDTDLDAIRNDKRYILILNKMENAYMNASKNAIAIKFIEHRDNNKGYLLNLHWKNDSIEHYRAFFSNCLNKTGISTIYIQSSQITSSKGYCWDNSDTAITEIEKLIFNDIDNIRAFNNRFNRIALLSRLCAAASPGTNRANDALPVKRMFYGRSARGCCNFILGERHVKNVQCISKICRTV